MTSRCRWILLWLLCAQLPLDAEFRTFKNDFGDTVDAELVELKEADTIVTLKLRNGSQIDAKVTAFSQDDQKFIRKWWEGLKAEQEMLKERSRITMSAKMNRKSKNGSYDSYYRVDDKTRSFFPEVVIENDELQTFTDNTVRVVVIAEDLRYEEQKLIVSATTVKADFPERAKTILETDPFRLRAYEYDSSYSSYEYKYGYEYEGYIIVIKNAAGEITHSRASKSKFLSNMDVIMKCKAGEIYDDGIDRKLNASPNSYYVQ